MPRRHTQHRATVHPVLGGLAVVGALAVAACSGAADDEVATAATTTTSPTTTAAATDAGGALRIDETVALDDGPGAPSAANGVPSPGPDEPLGRIGFTRYVYVRAAGTVIPSLVEGPVGGGIRCQDPALPCSAEELRALAASDEEPPDALDLTRAEVDDLAAELDAVAAAIASVPTPEEACAQGFRPDRTQTPNMGSHFVSMERILDGAFDPARPEIIMFARPDGTAPDGPLGTCGPDGWDGVDAVPVGVAFFQPFAFVGEDHPEGFTGDLDNWHVHYNLCRLDGRDLTVPPEVCAGQAGTVGEFEPAQGPVGEASEGWMIHAWADPTHDNQLGAFSMWNASVWPVTDPEAVGADGSLADRRGGGTEVIDDFTLPDVVVDGPGPVTFFNADGVAHTVTAGTPADPGTAFDSGIIGVRSATTVEVDAAADEVPYFCTLHPDMTGTIRVAG